MEKISISIIDDNSNDIEFVEQALKRNSDFVFLEGFSNVTDFFSKTDITKSDIILLDIFLIETNGIYQISKISSLCPKSLIIMYTISEQTDNLMKALELGASGYILKTNIKQKFLTELSVYKNGGAYISPLMSRKLISFLTDNKKAIRKPKILTEKEYEVLVLISQGWTYLKISQNLDISIDAIRARIKSIYSKLKVKNKIEAINVLRKDF